MPLNWQEKYNTLKAEREREREISPMPRSKEELDSPSCNYCQIQAELDQSKAYQASLKQEIEILQEKWMELHSSSASRKHNFQGIRKELELKLEAVQTETEKENELTNQITYLDNLPQENQQLLAEKQGLLVVLKHTQNYTKTLQAELDSRISEHADCQKWTKYEIDILRQSLRDAEKLLKEKNQEQENQTSQLNYSHRSFQREVQRRQKLIQRLEAERHQLNQKGLTIASQLDRIKELASDLATERNQLEKERAENSRHCLAVFHQDTELTHLKQAFSELEQIAQDYWNHSQREIKKWQTEAETHLEALELTEIWNREKWERLEKEKQDLIQIINQKNDELDELEVEASLTDFQSSKEKTEQIERSRTELIQLRQHYENHLNTIRQEIICLGEETNALSQELATEEVLVDLKDHRIDKLAETIQSQTQKINHLTKSGLRKQKTIIELSQKLGNDQTKIKDLTELLTKSQKQVQQLEDKQKKLARTRAYQTNRVTNLEQENQTLQSKLVYYSDQDKRLRGTIQSLQNHACPSCSLTHLPEPHVCPIVVNEIDCSHSDYSKIKEQRDQHQKQAQNKEREIIQELNTILELNLNNPNLKQVISEIQKLIAKDPITVQKQVNRLEQELANQNTPFGEDLAVIKDLEIKGLKELLPNRLEEEIINQIKQVQNYQQLTEIRNNFLMKNLAKNQKAEVKEASLPVELAQSEPVPVFAKQERYIWIGLLAVSLLTISGLLIKLKRKNLTKG